jgi:tetratricopeptide (TPR) repeat protein
MNESAFADRPRISSATSVAGGYGLQTAEQAYRRVLVDQPRHIRALCGLAVVRNQLGAHGEARDLIARAEAVAGRSAEDHVALGTAFIRIGDLDSAQRQFEAAIARDDGHAGAKIHLANVLSSRGEVAGAVIQYEKALAIDPGRAEAHQNLGLAQQQLGQYEPALAHHEAALAISPKSAGIHASLGDACRHLGRHDVAIGHYVQALTLDPGLTDACVNLGGCLHLTGQREQAIRAYQEALKINPALADAHYNLGNLHAELDDPDAAIVHYERSISLVPTSAEAHNNLANVFLRRGRRAEAIEHFRRAVSLKPTYLTAMRSLGDALQSENDIDAAIACFRAALAVDARDAVTLNRLASALLVAGDLEGASRAFETAIGIAPENIGIQHNYASVKAFRAGDPRLAPLEELHAREGELSDYQRIVLNFTLGKAYADLKDADRSFRHLDAGNRLKRRLADYDERGTLSFMQRLRDVFTRDFLAGRLDVGHPSEAPVFVIGMPRSGTSLVEQILASHPRIFGAGEVDHLAMATSDATARCGAGEYPDAVATMSAEDFRDLGKAYVERLGGNVAGKDRIVDKLPHNFLFAGLIHLALPRARIIHVRRNAVDTCVSCYSLLFAEEQPFAYDLAELGRYYGAYEALMAHWRAVLPPGRMLEVDYEELVGDFETQARRLVSHCGVDWDERCLAFHETRRAVNTASLTQVRKSIYASSVGRSRFYGPRLKPLVDALGIEETASSRNRQPAAEDQRKPTENVSDPPVPASRAAEIADDSVDLVFQVARKLQARGELGDAEPIFRIVLAMRPGHFDSLLAMGAICAATKRPDEAKRHLEQAVAANQGAAEAHGALGAVHTNAGEFEAAEACYHKALLLAPDHPGIHYAYATLLQSGKRNDEAIEHLKRAVSGRADHIDAHFALGNLLYAGGQDAEATGCYLKVLQLNPRHAETHNNLANAYQRQGLMERAVVHYKTAIEINPSYADAHGNLGNAYLVLDRLEESIEQNRRALELNPSRFGSYNNRGIAFQALGRFEEAEGAFAQALELAPREGHVHLNLANMSRFKAGDRRLPGLQALLRDVEALDLENQIAAYFAMGKALGDLGQYRDAFRHLAKGNALKRRTFDYDEPQRLAMFENIRTVFSHDFMAARSGVGDPSRSPIFIVGMPRSGTTLMEQVLASHSKVFGAGELETFKEVLADCVSRRGIVPAYPVLVEALQSEQLRELGEMYVAQSRVRAGTAERVVDKMPLNFVFAGLIHLALPNARFINLRRDPLDTCVSCFSLLFNGSQPFAYDLAELGRYYRGYERVMEHWHEVLPSGVMIDVHYEDLVDDLEGTARRVLRHCDLDWEDACRDFHDTQRAVRTASLMQVREPVYRRALGSWRRYAEFLEPLGQALGVDIKARLADADTAAA